MYRLEFGTRGFVRRADGEITTIDRHVVALRFLPDYLRNADRFAMLRLIEPGSDAFHPNISAQGAICIEIYPGESLIEICRSLHDLFRWRLRQYDERDALNPIACGWGATTSSTRLTTGPYLADERVLTGSQPRSHQDADHDNECEL